MKNLWARLQFIYSSICVIPAVIGIFYWMLFFPESLNEGLSEILKVLLPLSIPAAGFYLYWRMFKLAWSNPIRKYRIITWGSSLVYNLALAIAAFLIASQSNNPDGTLSLIVFPMILPILFCFMGLVSSIGDEDSNQTA